MEDAQQSEYPSHLTLVQRKKYSLEDTMPPKNNHHVFLERNYSKTN